MKIRHLALISALALATPTAILSADAPADVGARDQWGPSGAQTFAFREGYDRGLRAGEEDSRRNQSFNFTDESDYRSADAGYRSQYGNRTLYRDEFRRGYAEGYRLGYSRYRDQYDTGRGGWGSGRRGGVPPPWANGRGRGAGTYGTYRTDPAFTSGYNDGYERGLDDGEDRRRNNPVAESRYRDADRGYERQYGTREAYKIRYRDGFLQGYQRGYQDGQRYSGRSWWPFR